MFILFLAYRCETVDLAVFCAGALQTLCIAGALMEIRLWSLLFDDVLVHFAEAVGDHFE